MKEGNLLIIEKLWPVKRQFTLSGVNIICKTLLLIGVMNITISAAAQHTAANADIQSYSLKDCIDYALQNQPVLKQSIINVSITKTTNAINLSGWMPQVGSTIGLVHYTQQPMSFINNPANPQGPKLAEKTGMINTFIPALSATQTIFNPGLLYNATSAKLYVKEAQLIIDSTKINIVSSVSKSFYNLLFTLQEINVLKEDTVRLAKNLDDSYHQYIGGIVDETDYEEAAITLNNSKAQLRQATENVVPQYAVMKQIMGYPPQSQFNVIFDTAEMIKEIMVDTATQLQYEKRIEYQQLATARALQHKLTNYYKYNFLPSLGAYFNYNYEYENDKFPELLSAAYPNSLVGLSLNFPLFTGLSRIESLHRAKLQEKLFDLSETNLRSEIYTEYTQSLANYRSNLYNFHVLGDNVAMARKVYTVVNIQYKQGVVAYLNVITAESNLISSEIGYINALFQVLSSKIDLEKSMGEISY